MKAPKCKTCGEEHWGLCSDHGAKGALTSREGVQTERLVVARKALAAAASRPTGHAKRKAKAK